MLRYVPRSTHNIFLKIFLANVTCFFTGVLIFNKKFIDLWLLFYIEFTIKKLRVILYQYFRIVMSKLFFIVN